MSLRRPQDREENDEGLHPSPPAKRPRCSCYCEQMELLKEMRSMLQGQNEKIESMLQGQNEKIESMLRENQELREKVSCLTADISKHGGYLQQSPAPRVLSDQNCSVPLRLQFVNSCSNDKYSTRKVEADDGTPLKVAIYNNNNNAITCEPFSSMRVRMVAIHGDFDNDHKGQWTEEHFHSKIITGRLGKEHLLSGELYFRLQDGVGYLNSAKFQDNSSFVPSKRFKLGVMAADERISERIQEGITESFAVKDVRGYSTKKNPNPSPRDPVYKLKKISMNGQRHKLLEQNGINTVDEFLCFHSKNPEELRKIFGKISDQDWDRIVNHAHKCNGRNNLKGSSMQPSPTLQKQLDVQVTNQEISSRCNGLSCGASSENVPSMSNLQPNSANQNVMPHELVGIQVTDRQVSSIGNEILSVSSMDTSTLEGSSSQQPDGMGTDNEEHFLAELEHFMLNEDEDASWLLPPTEIPCNTVEQNGGHSLVSEAGSISYRGHSLVSEAGSISYRGLSSVSEAGSISYRGLSPVRGASSTSYGGHSRPPVRGAGSTSCRGHSPSPVTTTRAAIFRRFPHSSFRGAGSTSNANTDFTGEEGSSWKP